jgi:hypothetical protein
VEGFSRVGELIGAWNFYKQDLLVGLIANPILELTAKSAKKAQSSQSLLVGLIAKPIVWVNREERKEGAKFAKSFVWINCKANCLD